LIKKIFCLLFLVLTQIVLCQRNLRGSIISNSGELGGIYVINAATEVLVITDNSGNFSIIAQTGDTLVFSSVQYKEVRIVVKEENFSDLNFSVVLHPVVHQLQEVVITRYRNINSVSMGITPGNQIKYTAAERKLHTATSLNANANVGSMAGGSVSADPLLNFLSGRTAMLKKEVAVEKKEAFIKLLGQMFKIEHFVDTLKIPVEYVKGFQYFAVENNKFTAILNANNKTTVEFLLGELAVKYKEIIAIENK